MSRLLAPCYVVNLSFPRVSGDEPDFVDGGVKPLEFSPRERG